MRLWLRLLLMMALAAGVPLLVVGWLAVQASRESAAIRPEEALSREASTLATFAGGWIDGQSRMLAGWQRVWDVRGMGEDYQLGLVRAVYKAMEGAVTVALVDASGRPVLPPQYLGKDLVSQGREAGSDARAQALLANLPRRLDAEGRGIGQPYVAPGGVTPVVPIAAGTTDSTLRLAVELSLEPLRDVFENRAEVAAVLVDGLGKPVLGADHPYLADAELDRILDLGLDLTFTSESSGVPYQGAVWSVPDTDWKVVVLAPPAVGARAAAVIRAQTFRVAAISGMVLLLVGAGLDRTLTRSVRALQAHAQAITSGDHASRNRVDRTDEIGELGLALNDMATRLEVSNAELAAFHRELQARVEARTAELRAAQDQLVRAGQVAAVGEVSAGLAHELNNPLSAILGTAQLLLATGQADAHALARIEEQAIRCREVVDTMERLGSSGASGAFSVAADLQEVVAEAVEGARPRYEARGVQVAVAPLEGLGPQVRIERAVVRRLVDHLLEALCAGLSEGARMDVRVERDRPEVVLTPDRPVAEGGALDDWMAAGLKSWSVRGLVQLAGGEVIPGQPDDPSWRVVFPEPA